MPTAFHTLTLRVSHRERAELKQQAKQQELTLTQLLRVRLGLPRAIVRGEDEPGDIEDLGGVLAYLSRLKDLRDGDNMLLRLIARKIGVDQGDVIVAREANTIPEPTEFAGGFARR